MASKFFYAQDLNEQTNGTMGPQGSQCYITMVRRLGEDKFQIVQIKGHGPDRFHVMNEGQARQKFATLKKNGTQVQASQKDQADAERAISRHYGM